MIAACLILVSFLWGFSCAMMGVAIVCVFGQDNTPFRWHFRWVSRWHERGGWRAWIASPLGGCVVCTSGQIGLWSYSLVRPWNVIVNLSWAWGEMPSLAVDVDGISMFLHLLSGCCAVLFAFTINRAYKWMERRM